MNIHFANGAISAMVSSAVITLLTPIILLVYYRFKKNANISRFFIGMAMYIVAGLFLSTLVNALLAFLIQGFGQSFHSIPWVYALSTTLVPAVLIQVGCYITLKVLLKKNKTPENALMLGVGIGSFSSLVAASIMISNAILAFYVNRVGISSYLEKLKLSATDIANQKEAIVHLSSRSGAEYFNVGANMLLLLIFQIALALFIYYCIEKAELRRLFPITIVLYGIFMFPWNLTQTQVALGQPVTLGSNGVLLFEGVVLACMIYFVRKIHNQMK